MGRRGLERQPGRPRGLPDEIARRLEDAVAKVIAGEEWGAKVRQLELAMAFLRGAEWKAQLPARLARCQGIRQRTPWQ